MFINEVGINRLKHSYIVAKQAYYIGMFGFNMSELECQ